MNDKIQKPKKSRKSRHHRLKYISILPSFITLLNAIFGFSAIIIAGKAQIDPDAGIHFHRMQIPYLTLAGYMILIAMFADMLDGRVARMSHSTSSFGGQLDSLSDTISFGIAPAYLVYRMFSLFLNQMSNFTAAGETLLVRLIWLSVIIYVSCAIIRLARFNVENEEDESAHMKFIGLPTPASAGVLVSLVIFQQEALIGFFSEKSQVLNYINTAIFFLLPVVIITVGLLMVSRVVYPHVINQYLRGKKPFGYLIRFLFLIGLVIWSWQTALLVTFWAFAFSGILQKAFSKLKPVKVKETK